MDEDQQVAVLLQLNLNGAGGGGGGGAGGVDVDLSPTAHHISINESSGSEQQDLSPSQGVDTSAIEKDFEFIRKHAGEADADFLHSLLDSQIDNPNRVETILCEVLNVPNATELIKEFRKTPPKAGEKRSINDSNPEPEEIKKKKIKDTETYLQQMRDMFPDADGLFLISECQQLENSEDFSRFINTVMISGLYPKKGAEEYTPTNEPPRVVEIVNDTEYRTAVTFSSEDEISSSGLIDSPRRRKRKSAKNNTSGADPNHLQADIEVVDISSDNTEPYDPATVEDIFSNFAVDNQMDVEELQLDPEPWATSLVEDIDNLLQKKFGNREKESNEPQPGPSRVNSSLLRGRLSLPATPEKSLAEIIEERRHNRRRSLSSFNEFERPSTSKGTPSSRKNSVIGSLLEENSDISSPEVSTTHGRQLPNGSESDATVVPDEETIKLNDEWMDEQTANLIRIFPNTDPSFLREEVAKMNGSSEAVNEFVVTKLEYNDMPTRAEYEKKKEMEALQNRYTNNFSIEDFLKAVPDPWKYFSQGNRNCVKYKSHSLCYLKSVFRKRYVRDIIDTFKRNSYNLYLSYQELKRDANRRRGSRRSEFECNSNRPTTIDIQFLQEVAFIENEEKIKDYIEGEKLAKQIKFDEAKRTGSLLECQCCFDSEVVVDDIVYCPKDHAFCRECIIKSVEVEMGNGRCQFECLSNCDEKFSLACLQTVLKPELFSKVLQATQMEEIRAAEIEDLVQCPFCNYATIMPPEEKVMTCLNPECLKESCRLCKELNHIPLRCDEVEKSEDVKMRTYIENKMTEALVRTCYKCGKKFVKEDGCNKMTCTCGAKMCYVCRKPVTNYSHFNGLGGTEYHKCPLYALNDELHVDLVRKVAEEAKAEILQANPQARLLHDPTMVMPERTHETPMPGMNNGVALNVGLRAIRGTLDNPDGDEIIVENQGNRHHRSPRRRPGVGRNRRQVHARRPHIHHHRNQVESEDDEDEDPEELEEEEEEQHHHHHHHHHHHQNHRNPHLTMRHRHELLFYQQQHRHRHNRHH